MRASGVICAQNSRSASRSSSKDAHFRTHMWDIVLIIVGDSQRQRNSDVLLPVHVRGVVAPVQRTEGWAFYLEEMIQQLGIMEDRPKGREINYALQRRRDQPDAIARRGLTRRAWPPRRTRNSSGAATATRR